jgi:hypothetical protein
VKQRRIAILLLVIAGAIYAGFALPARKAATDAGEEYRRARDRRREALARLVQLERQDAARQRAVAAMASMAAAAAERPGSALIALRRSVLASIEGSGASNVRLAVQPGRPPVAATVQLSAEGSFADAVQLAGKVARPEMGIVLQSVRLTPYASGVRLELEGVSLGALP